MSAGARGWGWEGAPGLHSPKGPVLLPPCSPRSHPCPLAPCQGSGRDVGIQLEVGSAPLHPHLVPAPGDICASAAAQLFGASERTKEPSGMRGRWGGTLGSEQALTAPPYPQFTAAPRSGKAAGAGSAGPGEHPPTPPQGTVLQFFTRLRRHASLDGASPYFRIKKWKLESTQRASSLDTRGGGQRGPRRAVWVCVTGGAAGAAWVVPPALPCAPQDPPSAGSFRGSGRPARAWTRRTGTPIRPTSSSTLPTRTTCPSTPRGAPSCPPPPAPHPLSAGIFQ